MKNIFPKAFTALLGSTLIMAGIAFMSHSQGWRTTEILSSSVGTLLGGGLGIGIMVFAVFMFISQIRSAIAVRRIRNEQRTKHDS
jgi:hypothetical protein